MHLSQEFAKEASNLPSRFPPPPPPPDNEPIVIVLFLFLGVLVVLMLLLVSSACQTWMLWKMAKAVVEREARFVAGKRKAKEDEEDGTTVEYAGVEDVDGHNEDGSGGEKTKRKKGTWIGGWFGAKRRE